MAVQFDWYCHYKTTIGVVVVPFARFVYPFSWLKNIDWNFLRIVHQNVCMKTTISTQLEEWEHKLWVSNSSGLFGISTKKIFIYFFDLFSLCSCERVIEQNLRKISQAPKDACFLKQWKKKQQQNCSKKTKNIN